MNEEQLERSLQSVGMACFVKYFHEFSDIKSNRADLIELLKRNEGYKESGCKTRVSQSSRIVKAERAKDALRIISKSAGVPEEVSARARQLMQSL